MQAVRTALIDRGVAPAYIQYEVFGLDLWQADLDKAKPTRLRIAVRRVGFMPESLRLAGAGLRGSAGLGADGARSHRRGRRCLR